MKNYEAATVSRKKYAKSRFMSDRCEFFRDALHGFTYTSYLDKCDTVNDFCKPKTHEMTGMSVTAKDIPRVIHGNMKPEYHFRFPRREDFTRMTIDIDEYFAPKIKLCTTDAI